MHPIFIYTFIVRYLQLVQLRQTSYKRQAAANAAALLSTVGKVVVKMCKVFGGPDWTGQGAVVWSPLY